MESYCIQKAIDCAGWNDSKHLDGFKALLRIPSISLDAAYQPQLRACADFILGEMELIGLQDCQLLTDSGQSDPLCRLSWRRRGQTDHPDLRPL